MMPDDTRMERAHVTVRGRVQAVGFRAHVERAARETGISGWVRNVGEDMVEAVAEADATALERFLDLMRTGPLGARVDSMQVERGSFMGEFEAFSVRRSV